MKRLSAEQAIEKIKSEKTTFLSMTVCMHNYGHEIRQQLQIMAQKNRISPAEYWKALKLTKKPESPALERYEVEKISGRLR